jgi:hypothetical protein
MNRMIPVILAAALAIPACAGREADHEPGVVPYFAGHTAMFPDGAAYPLGQVPRPRLRGADGPVAVRAGDGIVYSTFDEKVRLDPQKTAAEQGVRDGTVLGRSSVRVAGSSGDRVLADGAFAPVVSATGRVAVGLLDEPDQRFGDRYDAAIAVLDKGTPTRWTESAGLRTPVAWVGDALLYAVPVEVGLPQLWVASGPGVSRQLVPAGTFVAASPDRQRVLVAVPAPERKGRLTFVVLSILDGRELARFPTELWWAGLGSWTARGITAVGAPEPGTLTALELTPELQPRRAVDFAVPAELAAPPNEVSVSRDQKSFGVATFVAGTAAPNLSWVLLDCTLAERECERTDLGQKAEYAGFVSDPAN